MDTILFPLDTIKTRLQSQQGFLGAGGFKRIYAGLGSSLVGSAPNGIGHCVDSAAFGVPLIIEFFVVLVSN